MATIEKSVEVDLPVGTVYNQWTQFEEFPGFMEGIEEVRQLDDTNLHWRVSIAGRTVEFDAVITDQVPDQQVAWRATSGAEHTGVVTFAASGPERTRVTATITYDPMRVAKTIGFASKTAQPTEDDRGAVANRVQGDMGLFKSFIEQRGSPTGSWRGEIQNGSVESGASGA